MNQRVIQCTKAGPNNISQKNHVTFPQKGVKHAWHLAVHDRCVLLEMPLTTNVRKRDIIFEAVCSATKLEEYTMFYEHLGIVTIYTTEGQRSHQTQCKNGFRQL